MEVGTEISQKIRSAIKAKLLELGSYVDDELPDYIMVMVANKKSRSQMNSDLGLFLGNSTDAFTEWLIGLLEKLQTIRVDSEKCSDKQGKTEKPKSSKDKKKDEKLPKGDSAGKRSGKDKDKKKASDCVSGSTVTDSKTKPSSRTSESQEEAKSDSSNADEHSHPKHILEGTSKNPTDKNILSGDVLIERQASDRHRNISGDFEDVRQLLVTGAAEDELTEELETTEVEVLNLRTVKDASKLTALSGRDASSVSVSNSANASQSSSSRSQSPENYSMQESMVARKRKIPTSVVATVRLKDGDEEEYDPQNPAVGSVASVVKVTARKSSVPPLLQANRLLLLKAMTEAERSVAAKKRVTVTKPVSRDDSPSEVYSPKRKRSDRSRDQASPPLYIPSRKDSINRHSSSNVSSQHSESRILSRNDARHVLNKDSSRELVSRSRREALRTAVIDRASPLRQKSSRSPEKGRWQRDGDKKDREVKSDRGLRGEKNFQITCHLSSNAGSAVSYPVDSRKRQHSPSPERKQTLQVTFKPIPVQDSKSAAARLGKIVVERSEDSKNAAARLGKIVVERSEDSKNAAARLGKIVFERSEDSKNTAARLSKIVVERSEDSKNTAARLGKIVVERSEDSKNTMARLGKIVVERSDSGEDARENVDTRAGQLVSSTRQRDAREDIIAKVGQSKSKRNSQKSSSSRVISSSGKEAAQKQCEAAVISVQAAQTSGRTKRNVSPDSRVVECDTQSIEEKKVEEVIEKSNKEESKPSTDVLDITDTGGSLGSGGDDDDLSKMIDEDLGPELLENTNGDEFTLDLDSDDDLSHVVGVTEDDTTGTDIQEPTKDEKRLGTRFIVTLDGVDERQFHAEDKSSIFEKFKQPPTGSAPVATSMSEKLQQSQNLYSDLLATQSRPASQAPLQQVQALVATVPSKLTPPKIQPFSISLKDSDDEHDDKEGKPSATRQDYYQETEGEVQGIKRAKISERCKFWPACAAGASCEYHHPTAHCKTFPSCKFGEKCLFIHPNCRFDSKCARPDCPYTHTSRRPAIASAAHVIAIPKSHFVFSAVPPKPSFVGHPSTQTMCRYFPNCHNMNCIFLHPKPCKFGIVCKSPACPFYHPPMPGKDRLKWQASSGQLKAEVASSIKMEPAVDKPSPSTPNNSTTVSSTSQ